MDFSAGASLGPVNKAAAAISAGRLPSGSRNATPQPDRGGKTAYELSREELLLED